MKNNPCTSCTRMKNPQSCTNKHCEEYRKWFIPIWNTNRLKVLAALTKKEAENEAETA